MNKKSLFISVLVIFVGIVYVGWEYQSSHSQSADTASLTPAQTETATSPTYVPNSIEKDNIKLTSTTKQTAFDLLKSKTDVQAKQYDFGVMIQSINGLKADNKHYWALYVNGNYATASADQTELNPGDIIEFKYEEIKNDFGK